MSESEWKWVSHIYEDDARYHVVSYYLVDGVAHTKCSEPKCIINNRDTNNE